MQWTARHEDARVKLGVRIAVDNLGDVLYKSRPPSAFNVIASEHHDPRLDVEDTLAISRASAEPAPRRSTQEVQENKRKRAAIAHAPPDGDNPDRRQAHE